MSMSIVLDLIHRRVDDMQSHATLGQAQHIIRIKDGGRSPLLWYRNPGIANFDYKTVRLYCGDHFHFVARLAMIGMFDGVIDSFS